MLNAQFPAAGTILTDCENLRWSQVKEVGHLPLSLLPVYSEVKRLPWHMTLPPWGSVFSSGLATQSQVPQADDSETVSQNSTFSISVKLCLLGILPQCNNNNNNSQQSLASREQDPHLFHLFWFVLTAMKSRLPSLSEAWVSTNNSLCGVSSLFVIYRNLLSACLPHL